MGFPRQEYWSELPFPSPGDLPHSGTEPGPWPWTGSSSAIHNNLFQGARDPEAQPQLLDLRIPSQPQEPPLPFEAVLHNLFPAQGALGPPPCQPPPGYAPVPPQPFNSPVSPLVPPATLLVPYPVIVPLPVRLLGTNGGSLWLWCCLAQPGALGP